jgi:uncharacterized membrane protein
MKAIAALFDDFENAAQVVQRLHAADIEPLEVSIIAHNEDDRYSRYAKPADRAAKEDDTVTGTVLGGILGAGAGLLTGLSLIAIPGLGPTIAAGWLVAALSGVGAAAGAAVGALAVTLTDVGLSAEEAEAYAEGVRRGGTLVVVRTLQDNIERVVEIFNDAGAVDIDERMELWRSEGWGGDPRPSVPG